MKHRALSLRYLSFLSTVTHRPAVFDVKLSVKQAGLRWSSFHWSLMTPIVGFKGTVDKGGQTAKRMEGE